MTGPYATRARRQIPPPGPAHSRAGTRPERPRPGLRALSQPYPASKGPRLVTNKSNIQKTSQENKLTLMGPAPAKAGRVREPPGTQVRKKHRLRR